MSKKTPRCFSDDEEIALLMQLCEVLEEFFALRDAVPEIGPRVLRYLRSRYGDFFLASEASEAGGGKK